MISLIKTFLPISAVFVSVILVGCGGGTDGSGLKTYEGNVSSKEGRVLSGVNVTIETTGESSVTNSNGQFVIKSDAYGAEVPFILESSEFENRFILKDITESSARITMDISVDTATDIIEVNNVRIRAWFAGLCDQFFENREVIRQANRVPPGTVCSLNVEVLGDGGRLSSIPVVLEVAACEPGSPWRDIKTVQTGEGPRAGSAEINFEFRDSASFCRYRVRVDTPARNSRFAVYPIDTFSEQEFQDK